MTKNISELYEEARKLYFDDHANDAALQIAESIIVLGQSSNLPAADNIYLAKAYNIKGNVLRYANKYEEALQYYDQALAIQDYPAPYYNKALVFESLNCGEKAVELYKKYIELDPCDAETHYRLANCIYDKNPEEARKHYEEAIRINSDYADAHYELALLLHTEKPEEAHKHYEEVIRIDPNHAYAHNDLAAYFYNVKNLQEAHRHYAIALNISNDDAKIHNNFALCLDAEGEVQEAIKHYKEALRINSNYAGACINLGNCLREIDLQEAVICFKEAIRINPNDAKTHYALGRCLIDIISIERETTFYEVVVEYYEEAIIHFKEAVRIDSNYAEGHTALANWLRTEHKPQEALEHVNKWVQLAPNNPVALCLKATLLDELGREVEAKGLYKKVYKQLKSGEDLERQFKLTQHNLKHLNESLEKYVADKKAKNQLPDEFALKIQQVMLQLKAEASAEIKQQLQDKFSSSTLLLEELKKQYEQLIQTKPQLAQYHDGFVHECDVAFITAQAVQGGKLSLDTGNSFVDLGAKLLTLVPFCGNTLSSGAQWIYGKVKATEIQNKTANLSKFGGTEVTFAEYAKIMAIKTMSSLAKQWQIEHQAEEIATKWWQQVAEILSKVKHKAEDLVAKNYARDSSPQYKLGQKDAQEVLAKLAGKEGYLQGVTKEAVLEKMIDYLTQVEGYYGLQMQPLEIEIPKQQQIAYQKQTDYSYKQEQKLPPQQQPQHWYEQQPNMNTQQLNSKSLNGYYQEDKSCCEKYCTIFRVQEIKYDHPLINLIYNGGSKIADLLKGATCNLSELLHSFDALPPTAQELALDCMQHSNMPLLQELLGDRHLDNEDV